MFSSFLRLVGILPPRDPEGYQEWIAKYDTLTNPEREWIRNQSGQLSYKPVFSVIMPVYNPPVKVLRQAIESVRRQLYPHWELCIADDASTNQEIIETLREYAQRDSRIKVTYRAKNGHISAASNTAIELATGEWTVLFDNDDELSEHALYCVAQEINDHPDVRLIYSDEDKITLEGRRYNPYFKPDWNPTLLTGQNFFSHLGAYRTDLIRSVDGFRVGYEGSQDYDLLWRCVEKVTPDQIRHIPRILYYWRALPGSVAVDMDVKNYALPAARRAMQDHLEREGIAGHVERCVEDLNMHRVVYRVPEPAPRVTVLIPMRDRLNLTKVCVQTLKIITKYNNFETVIIDNESQEEACRVWLREFASQPQCRVIPVAGEFSFSRINNEAVRQTAGEILLFLNNDVEILHEGWMNEMVGQLIQRNVAAVGARLWFPNKTLQHGGVIFGVGGVANHSFLNTSRGEHKGFGRNVLAQNYSAVTAACMAVKRACFDQVGGFDEANLPIQFNDLDLCLRLREAGFDIVWTPYAELMHHESKSRGYNTSPEQKQVLECETAYFTKRWGKWIEHDPAYNPNLTTEQFDFTIGKTSRLQLPWRMGKV
jgi:GT2 family glycosyltransferase